MNEHHAKDIRNVALVGHGGAGKTMMLEALFYTMGKTTRMGSVSDGNTISDYTPEEHSREYSLSTAVAQAEYNGLKLNILDAPGYTDFIGEAIAALAAADNALVVVNAQTGVEVGTELMWRQADENGMPRMIAINACSREHADFSAALAQCVDRFGGGGSSVVAVQFPVNQGEGFNQVVDVLANKAFTYESGGKGKGTAGDIPAEVADRVASLREELIEAVAESDEELLEKYLEEGELDDATLTEGLKKAVHEKLIIPVLATDAQHNVGTDRLIEWIGLTLASPADVPTLAAKEPDSDEVIEVPCDDGDPLCAYVFKSVSEAHVGELSFIRVYSGQIKQGMDVANAKQDSTERIGSSFFLFGKEREDAGHINAGDIGALVKLKGTHTGDTLAASGRKVLAKEIKWPLPNIEYAIEPKTKGDEDKVAAGLHRLHEEDPTFLHAVDAELGQTLISGQGELHLGVMVKKLEDHFGVGIDMVKPKIPYRETIRKSAEGQYRHKKQTGGRGQFGDVSLRIEPNERGEGYEFINEIVGGVIPGKFIPAVEKGVIEALQEGTVAGFRVVDVKAAVYFGAFHPVDSSEVAFKIAGLNAFKAAMQKANPVLLEPIYNLEITVPEEFMGDVMGDLSGRRGKIMGMDANGPFQIIRAQVPLANLYRYSTDLRSMSGGRGIFIREFSHYEEVPADATQKVVEELQAEKEKEE